MDQNGFFRLRRDYTSALADYMAEAQTMCEMFASCASIPLGDAERLRLMTQRVRENEAQANYQEMRSRLFEAARLGYRLAS
jgi:hypothetical protein